MNYYIKKIKANVVGITTIDKDYENNGKVTTVRYRYVNCTYEDINDKYTKGKRAQSFRIKDEDTRFDVAGEYELEIMQIYAEGKAPRYDVISATPIK